MTNEQMAARIERLERCLLGVAAMISGEARAVTSEEEFAQWQEALGRDMQAMSEEQKGS